MFKSFHHGVHKRHILFQLEGVGDTVKMCVCVFCVLLSITNTLAKEKDSLRVSSEWQVTSLGMDI